MQKVKTIDLKGKQYAQVKDRLKIFREQNPRAKIETIPLVQEDGQILFKATILADKADEHSPEATGHALGKNGGVKAFEKLEVDFIKNNSICPIVIENDTLQVATSEPANVFIIEDVRRRTQMEVCVSVCSYEDIVAVCNSFEADKVDYDLDDIINDI